MHTQLSAGCRATSMRMQAPRARHASARASWERRMLAPALGRSKTPQPADILVYDSSNARRGGGGGGGRGGGYGGGG